MNTDITQDPPLMEPISYNPFAEIAEPSVNREYFQNPNSSPAPLSDHEIKPSIVPPIPVAQKVLNPFLSNKILIDRVALAILGGLFMALGLTVLVASIVSAVSGNPLSIGGAFLGCFFIGSGLLFITKAYEMGQKNYCHNKNR